jgi:hypothetical protein
MRLAKPDSSRLFLTRSFGWHRRISPLDHFTSFAATRMPRRPALLV